VSDERQLGRVEKSLIKRAGRDLPNFIKAVYALYTILGELLLVTK